MAKISRWLQNSMDNLLPLSESDDFTVAMTEWRTTGNVIKAEPDDDDDFICQLCEKEALRSHFEIENELNGNKLWTGSKCILKFTGIRVIDPDTGEVMSTDKDRQRILSRQLRRIIAERKKAEKEAARAEEMERQLAAMRVAAEERQRREAELAAERAAAEVERQRKLAALYAAIDRQRDMTLVNLRLLYRKATRSRNFIERVALAVKGDGVIRRKDINGICTLLSKFGLLTDEVREHIHDHSESNVLFWSTKSKWRQ